VGEEEFYEIGENNEHVSLMEECFVSFSPYHSFRLCVSSQDCCVRVESSRDRRC
jgi:hypothetical protein